MPAIEAEAAKQPRPLPLEVKLAAVSNWLQAERDLSESELRAMRTRAVRLLVQGRRVTDVVRELEESL